MRDELGQAEIAEALKSNTNPYSILLNAMPQNPTELLVLPYFCATGTPYFDTRAEGAIIGIRHTTSKGDITKALLEGVALEMKLNLELMEKSGMKINTFIATGGGTRNNIWTQLKADVLNKDILVRETKEAGCWGAAALACSAAENIDVVKLLRQNIGMNEIFSPDPDKAGIYDDKFQTYKQLYPVLKQFWKANK
jgi:xylulokinase